MGKRKKSSRKPATSAARKRTPLDTTFTCLFCHHEKSVNVKIDRKEGIATLLCRICGQRFQGRVNHLTEPIDVYSEWIDAADAAQNEMDGDDMRRAVASGSRPRQRAEVSDDD
ncbi:Elf1-domain-containing protein [Fomitiporia mediterranea MF3/22]|uniref:Elf1-domain-containing protein n=1 Tax=Fomitiporia mediterranea (strain MF3/22) TaxID=694068 RepID=UPI0004407713|nr:Elf1-domain-containing protein [Fomitiporia mediterranea MF3/22]EJD06037.1 Elf1-domain-containing protein [Fomitiporia mediterranea MF3/22]